MANSVRVWQGKWGDRRIFKGMSNAGEKFLGVIYFC